LLDIHSFPTRRSSDLLEEPKDPEACNVFKIFRLVAPADAVADVAAKYRAGGYGYGHAKKELLAALLDGFATERDTFARLMADKGDRKSTRLNSSHVKI